MKTVRWTNGKGQEVEVKIEVTHEVKDKVENLDGHKVNLGKETVDNIYIEMLIDGKFTTRSYYVPEIITKSGYSRSYEQLVSAGAYARLGDVYIGKESYEEIMEAINSVEASDEYKKVKSAEVETAGKEKVNLNNQRIKNGLCPKCGTYCYGDCEI